MTGKVLSIGMLFPRLSLLALVHLLLALMVVVMGVAMSSLFWLDHQRQEVATRILKVHQPAIVHSAHILPQLMRMRDLLSMLDADAPVQANYPLALTLHDAISIVENDLRDIHDLHQLLPAEAFQDMADKALDQVSTLQARLPCLEENALAILARELLPPLLKLDVSVRQIQQVHLNAIASLTAAEGGDALFSRRHGFGLFLASLILFAGLVTVQLLRDIRRLHRLQQDSTDQARSAQHSAENASQAKSHFLVQMSREIRTPLNAIMGMSEMLRETGLNREQQQFLAISHAASENLLAMVNNILDVSRLETGDLTLERTSFELAPLVENIGRILELRTRSREIQVHCRMAPATPNQLVGDGERLAQILFNLTANAIRRTEQGSITLTVAPAASPAGDAVRTWISFQVTHTGVTEGDGPTTATHQQAMGFGLFMCQRLIATMGGHLTITPNPLTMGATLELLLPFLQDTEVTHPLQRLRVLVVHADTPQRRHLQELLFALGCPVVVLAEQGSEGLERFRRSRESGAAFGLVILECGLSDMEWIRMGSEIRLLAPTTPLILIPHGQCSPEVYRQAGVGVSAILPQPIDRQSLADALDKALTHDEVVVRSKPGQRPATARGTLEHPWRILTVDDSEDGNLLVQAFLQGGRHRVDAALNGLAALEKMRFNQYDLILMDIQMPVLDGLETTRRWRKTERERNLDHTPVVALTANALSEDQQQALAAGCDLFLTKPIRKKALLEAMHRLLETGGHQDPG